MPRDTLPRRASIADVLICLGTTVGLLAASVLLFGSDASGGASQIALLTGAAVTACIGLKNGHGWPAIERSIVQGIGTAVPAVLILLSVGSLIGVWMLSGTVPTLIYYGLEVLQPVLFYPAACVLCALVALSIGSSWTVAGTLGVALIGVAAALGLSVAITAGAIISGAYLGDKLSPLSDTTNLASGVSAVDLFEHIRHMMWTTLPGFAIAVLIFALISAFQPAAPATAGLEDTLVRLQASFSIGPLMLSPVVLVVFLAARRVPALGAILAGMVLGLVVALVFQRAAILALTSSAELRGGGQTGLRLLEGIWSVLFAGYRAETGSASLDELLSRGGMGSMLNTVWLILSAMTLGGTLGQSGVLDRLLQGMLKIARSTGGLIATTLGTCVSINALAADQYMSLVLPGRMYAEEYDRRGLARKNLSRALEDGGTLTSPLVPWNTCGAFMGAALGVPTLAYLPFCFFNLVTPLISALYGFSGFKIEPCPPAAAPVGAGVPSAEYPRPEPDPPHARRSAPRRERRRPRPGS